MSGASMLSGDSLPGALDAPRVVIRASALNAAARCAATASLPRRDRAFLSRGHAVHEQMAAYLGPDGWKTLTEEQQRWCESVLQRIPSRPAPDAEIETERAVTLGDVRVTGHTDAAGKDPSRPGHMAVWDWKTGWRGGLLRIADDLQMAAYAVMVGQGLSCDVTVYRVSVDGPSPVTDWLTYSPADRERVSRRIVDVALSTVHSSFTPGKHCDTCLKRTFCPDYSSRSRGVDWVALSQSEALSPDEASHLVDALGPMREALDSCESLLRRYLEQNGPVSTFRGVWSLTGSQSWRVTDPLLVEAIVAKHAPDHVAKAMGKSATKSSVLFALRAAGKTGSEIDAVLKEIQDAGGATVSEYSKMGWSNGYR